MSRPTQRGSRPNFLTSAVRDTAELLPGDLIQEGLQRLEGHAFNQQVAGEIVELHRDVARAISHRSVYSLTSTVGRFRRRRTALYWLPTAPNTAYSARDTRSYPFVRKPGNRLP